MEFGLSNETIQSIRAVFSQYKHIGKVWLFGSRSKRELSFRLGYRLAIKSEQINSLRTFTDPS